MGSARKRPAAKNNEKEENNGAKPVKHKQNTQNARKQRISPTIYAIFLFFVIIFSIVVYVTFFSDSKSGLDKYLYSHPSSSSSSSSSSTNSNKKKSEGSKDSRDSKISLETKEKPRNVYKLADITNKEDNKIRNLLDDADKLLSDSKFEEANTKFDSILMKYPSSPRANYGKAHSLDLLSEKKQSNTLLEASISAYSKILDFKDVPPVLLLKAGLRLSNRQEFRGWSIKSVVTMKKLIQKFPDKLELRNKLGISFMMSGKIEEAREVFKGVLQTDPNDGCALVHYGFILKTTDRNANESISYLQRGIASNAPETQHGRFYFHLGDAYYRVNKMEEGMKVYEEGAKKKIFLSKWQRSLYNIDHLTGRPWWTLEQTGVAKQLNYLAKNWETIRDEAISQIDAKSNLFEKEDEDLTDTGEWHQLTLFQRGKEVSKSCKRTPKTCALFSEFSAATMCKRGQIKFSIMKPGVHVHPHTGPTNCRLRAHLGLIIPKGPKIRVKDSIRGWKEGDWIIFDDSFEHEVWHNGTSLRMVLIVDFWHPELTSNEKRMLSPI